MARDLVAELFQVAENLADEKVELLARIGANRRSLRDLASQGLLDDTQAALVDEIYPPRERSTVEEAVAA
jgi:hypothetical protein